MLFKAADIVQAAFDRAPEFRTRAVDNATVARAFNQALKAVVFHVYDTDPERLAQTYTIEQQVVAQDPIDLTAVVENDKIVSGRREWLHIYTIDWIGADGDGDEVWISEIASRHRAPVDYEGRIIAIAIDQQRKLRKVGDWSGVHTLEVYGVLAPQRVSERTLWGQNSPEYDYPAVVEEAVVCKLVTLLAQSVPGIDRTRRQEWEADLVDALERLEADAADHISSTIRALEVHVDL